MVFDSVCVLIFVLRPEMLCVCVWTVPIEHLFVPCGKNARVCVRATPPLSLIPCNDHIVPTPKGE